ncbi:MAG: 50S ribosomal protein L2 [Candidatus Pacebacteria bacterium]|nr:50S ribosomal protein L2 [Candidatus Paceibacterota bacterium]
MALKVSRPVTPGRRHRADLDNKAVLTTGKPQKSLLMKGVYKRQGRNNTGSITVRHRGGGVKRKLRMIDWKREKREVPAVVNTIEYDPMRTANIALLTYKDGEKRYILAPDGLKVGDVITTGESAELRPGNALPLSKIPVGVAIHNIELQPGKGAQLIRAAGAAALIQSKEGKFVTIQLPSKEVRLVNANGYATIGQVGNAEWKTVSLGKAGRSRLMGWRPTVRGTAMHPNNHPHGGGEGRSGVGLKAPKSPWGKRLGKKTRSRRKYSNAYIVKDRRIK